MWEQRFGSLFVLRAKLHRAAEMEGGGGDELPTVIVRASRYTRTLRHPARGQDIVTPGRGYEEISLWPFPIICILTPVLGI